MAYLDDQSGRRRTALAGVAVVHALMGWALVSGLASKLVEQFKPAPITATNVPERVRPAPPPEPAPTFEDVQPEVFAPTVDALEPSASERGALTTTPPPQQPTLGTGLSQGPVVAEAEAPPPPAAPVLRGAVAGPGVVLTTDDYPDASRRAGEEGAMRVRVAVGADGRVTGCEVTASTGFPRLDARACQVAQRRWRFQPATEDGRPVASSVERRVVWRLEER